MINDPSGIYDLFEMTVASKDYEGTKATKALWNTASRLRPTNKNGLSKESPDMNKAFDALF
jgi:hypothetical protein